MHSRCPSTNAAHSKPTTSPLTWQEEVILDWGPLLGLAGEIGTLMAGYKKFLRDGSAYELFEANVEEELGDILWYLANAAQKFDLSLQRIADKNLKKTADRWHPRRGAQRSKRCPSDHLDAGYGRTEQLPRTFEVEIRPVDDPAKPEPMIEVIWNGKIVASRLGDNTYKDSGYRFHDAFHLANAAVLGWSPVARSQIFCCKRRSNPVGRRGGRRRPCNSSRGKRSQCSCLYMQNSIIFSMVSRISTSKC